MRQFSNLFLLLSSLMFSFWTLSCDIKNPPDNQTETVLVANDKDDRKKFDTYWYSGEGEVNTFEFEQSRYGERRKGEAIMVFVTEPFSKKKQVKLDDPTSTKEDVTVILKLNHIRRFVTGIYDYSMMQSIFTPINLNKTSNTLKVTTTSQDWCGHSFMQTNFDEGQYKISGFSYFESEGDKVTKLKSDLLEDELWTQIRINPDNIKEGNYDFIPSNFYTRLSHDKLQTKQARIRKQQGANVNFLILEYLHLDRTMTISYTPSFPYKIISWTEVQNGETLSKGKLKASIKSAYWQKHGNQDEHLRDSIGL